MKENTTQNALVTGSGSGLGYELTRMHAEQGWFVFALDCVISDELKALGEKHPDNIQIILCDIGSTQSVENALAKVIEKTTHISRLFNNAGIHRFKDWVTLDETELDFCQVMFNINAVGALRVVKAALDLLGEGTVIINTSSEAGSITDQTSEINYAYCMSKAAMNMGARIMDNWLSKRGVRTIMIHPGRMRTAMRGSHSNIDPWETAEGLMNILDHINDVPPESKFFDYKGVPYNW
jgi:NAD(P)-dependent dehydrogenase (short-subunit alcohol dehydrogenase family)